jgi:hypothetical protein
MPSVCARGFFGAVPERKIGRLQKKGAQAELEMSRLGKDCEFWRGGCGRQQTGTPGEDEEEGAGAAKPAGFVLGNRGGEDARHIACLLWLNPRSVFLLGRLGVSNVCVDNAPVVDGGSLLDFGRR